MLEDRLSPPDPRPARAVAVFTSRPGAVPPRRIWAATLALGGDQLVAWGVLYCAYSALSAPMASDLGLSRRFVAGAFSLTLLVSAGLAAPVGRALDRAGPRGPMLVGAVLGALAWGVLAAARTPGVVLLAFAALGAAQALSLYDAAFRTTIEWFDEPTRRTRALLLLTTIGAFASTVFLPLTTTLVERLGWRLAVVVLALAYLSITLPIRWALPRGTAARRRRDECPPPAPGGAAGRLISAAFGLQALAATAVSVCLIWQLVERGTALHTAATVAGLAGAAQVPGRVLVGRLQRSLRTRHRLPLLFAIQAGALLMVAVGPEASSVAGVLLFGAASGMMTLERAAVTIEWFGTSSFGARAGRIGSVALAAKTVAPYLVEALHAAMSYAQVFSILAVVLVIGAGVAMAAARARMGTG